MKNTLKVGSELRRTVNEVPLGPARVQQGRDVDGRAREVPKFAARFEADAERSPDVHDPLAESDRRTEVTSGGVGELDGDAAEAADTTGQDLGVEGFGAVAGEANCVFDVKCVPVGCV